MSNMSEKKINHCKYFLINCWFLNESFIFLIIAFSSLVVFQKSINLINPRINTQLMMLTGNGFGYDLNWHVSNNRIGDGELIELCKKLQFGS